MTYTFFKAQGKQIGKSLLEEDKIDLARELLEQGAEKIILPVDCMVSDIFDFDARKVGALEAVAADAIPADRYGLDIGPQTIAELQPMVRSAKTVVWNGPMGVFEIEESAKGTYAIAKALADATANGATTVIGGGDSAAAINNAGMADKVSHVSTGGGASLELMEGKALPGVAALSDK
jgi:phosphoglycerate kinase